MVMNKDYFLARLANGEDMVAIGQDVADMMNAAVAEHNARIEAEAKAKAAEEAAIAEKEAAKRDLIEELVEIVQELAILEGMDPDELQVTEEDMEQLVAAFTEMFGAMRELKALFAAAPTPKQAKRPNVTVIKSDDDILAEFAKMFS